MPNPRWIFFNYDRPPSPGHSPRLSILRWSVGGVPGPGILARTLSYSCGDLLPDCNCLFLSDHPLLSQGLEGNLQLPARLFQLPVEVSIPHIDDFLGALFLRLGKELIEQ